MERTESDENIDANSRNRTETSRYWDVVDKKSPSHSKHVARSSTVENQKLDENSWGTTDSGTEDNTMVS